jgi:hypothetical protein
MKQDLQERVLNTTWHEVVFFQLRSIALPQDFEREIQNTEVKGQDIHTATKESERENVKFNTNVRISELAVNATLETAYGNANRTIFEAEAVATTISEKIKMQADAFGYMKGNLSFTNSDVLSYLKNNLIKDYEQGRMVLSMDNLS